MLNAGTRRPAGKQPVRCRPRAAEPRVRDSGNVSQSFNFLIAGWELEEVRRGIKSRHTLYLCHPSPSDNFLPVKVFRNLIYPGWMLGHFILYFLFHLL